MAKKKNKYAFQDSVPRKILASPEVANVSMMGRLASRMQSRDMIDELNLGNKGRTSQARQAQVADNNKQISNMADQARANGNVYGSFPNI